MKSLFLRFTRDLLVLSFIISAIALLLYYIWPSAVTPAILVLIPFFIITTTTLFIVLSRASTGKFSRFTNYFMIATLLKLLILLTTTAIYIFFFRSDAIRFAITVFVLYIIYTVLEVRWLLKMNRNS
jgi:hypothetical protein